jgi:DNA-binding transcriptional ArsR family regulator
MPDKTNEEIESLLKKVFDESAITVIDELSEEFSVEDFREKLAQCNQKDYIKLLELCEKYKFPFSILHRHISSHLKRLDYEELEKTKTQPDTFGNSQRYAMYAKTKKA